MRIHSSHLLLLWSVFACAPPRMQDPAAARRAIEANNAAAERWYASGNVDSLVAMFGSDVRQFPPNMPAIVGRDSLRAFWAQAFQWGRWEFDLQTEDVVASGPFATERGRYTLTFTPGARSPIPAMSDRGNYVVFWRRDPDGRWRAVWDAPVSELPRE
jgi:ketosteroid isomerase-like protein